MLSIKDANIKNKKVILRLDLNVTIKEGKIVDDTKIVKSLPTIEYLANENNHLLIMSHLGRVKTAADKNANSLELVYKRLNELLDIDVVFVDATRGSKLEKSFKENPITLMQNTRYEDIDDNKESGCDDELARYWASLADVFVNDAFATSHRKHASNYGISKYLDSYTGFLVDEELNILKPLVDVEKRPFTVIMGGAKVDDKIKLISSILKECDYLLVGGGIANTFLAAKGIKIGKSLYSPDYVDEIKKIYDDYKDKIIIPIDYVLEDGSIKSGDVTSSIMDIGPETVKLYKSYLEKSELIFINGTVGLYEDSRYKNGTYNLLDAISKTSALKIAGGGDAVASIKKLGFSDKEFNISTGGGATLEYITNKKMKCFEE